MWIFKVSIDFDKTKPIRTLLKRAGIQEILDLELVTEVAINRPGEIWFEREGIWECSSVSHLDILLCNQLVQSLAIHNHGLISSVILPDGERGQIVLPPASEYMSLTIRKLASKKRYTLSDYQKSGRLSCYKRIQKKKALEEFQKEMVMCLKKNNLHRFFELAVFHKQNLLFGGGTGSGKTTFSKAIVDLYSRKKRYITIEDVHELDMPYHPNKVHLFFGKHITAKKLVESCMRMKADHIFMSELRGDETWSYLTLLNTGHNGSLTTAHFNDAKSAIARLAQLIKQSDVGLTLDYNFIYRTVSIDIICVWQSSYLKEIHYEPEEQLNLL
jgi:type IV secretion system protein VirB11